VHQLFPLNFIIKDKAGIVAIVEFKEGLQIYQPDTHDAILANAFFEAEKAFRKAGIKSKDKEVERVLDIQNDLKKNPMDVQKALHDVGNYYLTIWTTESKWSGDEWTYRIRIQPEAQDPNAHREMTVNLTQAFKSFPKNRQFLLYSEFSKNGLNSARPLSDKELAKIQLIGFGKVAEKEDTYMSRNEDLQAQSTETLHRLLAQLQKGRPISHVTGLSPLCGSMLK
jgi:hypothetical protein